MISVNTERTLVREADSVLRGIFEGLPGFRVESHSVTYGDDKGYDLILEANAAKTKIRFAVDAKARVTPQTALAICRRLKALPGKMIPVLFAPVVSPRVAEIAREQGVGYFDRAGNCWLQSLPDHLLIERQGLRGERQTTVPVADPFSVKSSRIVRAMLSRPIDGWQVRQLA